VDNFSAVEKPVNKIVAQHLPARPGKVFDNHEMAGTPMARAGFARKTGQVGQTRETG
jgi:hypothetical protein